MWKIRKIVKKGDYLYAVVSEHPRAIRHGYVLLHRILVENHLGKLLNSEEVVHHIDGNTKNNDISNLVVMSEREHALFHLKTGRSMVELRCPWCGLLFVRERRRTYLVGKSSWTACSPRCSGKLSRQLQLFGLTAEVELAISRNLVREFNSLDNPEQTENNGMRRGHTPTT